MEKLEAIALMEKGIKVTHRHFSSNEWMTMESGRIVLEDGVKCSPLEFWQWRTDETWNDGYFIFN